MAWKICAGRKFFSVSTRISCIRMWNVIHMVFLAVRQAQEVL